MPNPPTTAPTKTVDATDPANQPGIDDQLDPTGDTTGTQDAPQEQATLNFERLNAAGDNADVWGDELARFLVALTGKHVDPSSLAVLFGAYGGHVQVGTYKRAALAAMNYPIDSAVQVANPLLAAMDVRSDIAQHLLQAAV